MIEFIKLFGFVIWLLILAAFFIQVPTQLARIAKALESLVVVSVDPDKAKRYIDAAMKFKEEEQ